MIKIGFFGPKGTFSQEALKAYIKDSKDYTEYDYGTLSELILAVQAGEIDEAIVPIENSLEGAINITMDMIAMDVDLLIKAEMVIPVRENLLVKKGTKLSDIKYILSHPSPIGQCRKYLNANFPNAVVKCEYSTSGAADEVAGGIGDSAAIGSIIAADVYGLEVADKDIHDNENNYTRFIVIGKQCGVKTGCDKTSIVFSTEDKPGSLYRILDIFNLWDINMNRIESRPAKNQLGRYIFFVDISGHMEDENIRDALTMVKRKTSFYKFLGSYPEYKCKMLEDN